MAEWQASRTPEAAPDDTDTEAWTKYAETVSDLIAETPEIQAAFLAGRTSQPVQVEVTDDMVERALFDVESKHHFHEVTCLCGFSSHRSRSRTEHITAEIRAALGGGDQ